MLPYFRFNKSITVVILLCLCMAITLSVSALDSNIISDREEGDVVESDELNHPPLPSDCGSAVECDEIGDLYLPSDCEFDNDFEVDYYAYMDLSKADDLLKEKILQARKIIISNTSWVADEINGCVTDRNGNVIRQLPHFHEIFPSSWEIPVVNSN